ncbi:MAG: metal-dependent transcriptional regulator, partial [Pedobacter sp.]
MLSYTEENYLKALLKLSFQDEEKHEVGTNEMAAYLGVKPATATDMLKKLKEKELVSYEKYGKITLTESGKLSGI